MGMVGGYELHLYCDHLDHAYKHGFNPGKFTGETRAETLRSARESGWIVNMVGEGKSHGIGLCLCPHHSGKKLSA